MVTRRNLRTRGLGTEPHAHLATGRVIVLLLAVTFSAAAQSEIRYLTIDSAALGGSLLGEPSKQEVARWFY